MMNRGFEPRLETDGEDTGGFKSRHNRLLVPGPVVEGRYQSGNACRGLGSGTISRLSPATIGRPDFPPGLDWRSSLPTFASCRCVDIIPCTTSQCWSLVSV